MPFFLVIDLVFRFSFVYCNKMSYTTLFTQEKPLYFKKEFLNKTIFYSVHPFAHIRQHYFSKYWGDQCMGRPPTSNFLGAVPPVPRSPPLVCSNLLYKRLERLGASADTAATDRDLL